jgi:hypothetical protein
METLIEYALQYGLTAILGLSTIIAVVKGRKYKIIAGAVDVIDTILESCEDGKITKAESEVIIKKVKSIIAFTKNK